ncbi:envelope stress response activation lipoprotein NlpE [Yokenella regensburgei]|uniref:envelope stress response activation lipoprotein NlpE n=1 Tax=Yokenella regensburgei TaxID=158877 RepID=UPI003F1778B2
MKRAILSLAAVITLFGLMGCNNRGEVQTVSPPESHELKPMQQSWRGILPCADCEGVETSLFLEKDGTWVMNQGYQGAKGAEEFASYGVWARTADKLVLTDTAGEKRYFRPRGDALEMLDREGNPIHSQLNYTLQPVKSALPATPMAMRGMYLYFADAATFTDCATGKRLPVKNSDQLALKFNQAKGTPAQALLLEVDGHYAHTPNPDTGGPVITVVTDKNARFILGKDCHHP